MNTTVVTLLVIFQVKHLLADYLLQRGFMLKKFLRQGWILPLAAHCAVHAAMTAAIALFFISPGAAAGLAAFDFGIHFIMDRIKAPPDLLGRYKPLDAQLYRDAKWLLQQDGATAYRKGLARRALRGNDLFWISLGLDQAVHHLTHYTVIWWMLR